MPTCAGGRQGGAHRGGGRGAARRHEFLTLGLPSFRAVCLCFAFAALTPQERWGFDVESDAPCASTGRGGEWEWTRV